MPQDDGQDDSVTSQPIPGAMPVPPSTIPAQSAIPGTATALNAPPRTMPVFTESYADAQNRRSLSSMLFMTFFFFMMSGNNTDVGNQDGDMQGVPYRPRELDYVRQTIKDYTGYLNGTSTNYTVPLDPEVDFGSLLPSPIQDASLLYHRNITGFYRNGKTHLLNLTSPSDSPISSRQGFFSHLFPNFRHNTSDSPQHHQSSSLDPPPIINLTRHNETLASQHRGEYQWNLITAWEMDIKEKKVIPREQDGSVIHVDEKNQKWLADGSEDWGVPWNEWNWVQSSVTITLEEQSAELSYEMRGLHHLPSGEYTFIGLPPKQTLDIRNIPTYFPEKNDQRKIIEQIILFELRRRENVLEHQFIMTEHTEDDPEPLTTCPLALRFSLPPLDSSYTKSQYDRYENEKHDPKGLFLLGPPGEIEIKAVAISEACGLAFGIDGVDGLSSDDFWSRALYYSIFASLLSLTSVFLLVQQMEATRTPSGLAKVSFGTIAMMVCADSWLFSAHLVVALMSDNTATLPMLVPGFFFLCTAIVFGPRFAMHISRVQAPESGSFQTTPVPLAQPVAPVVDGSQGVVLSTTNATTANDSTTEQAFTVRRWLQDEVRRYPALRWAPVAAVIVALIYLDIFPDILPVLLVALYSFWIPQIWRNATRGNRKALSWTFVVGSSLIRMCLPLYAFAYGKNVFFVEPNPWVWLLCIWVALQVGLLFAQDRLGPAFFLPSDYAPAKAYDYHQPIPPSDSEALEHEFGDCSICMEPIILPSTGEADGTDSSSSSMGPSVGKVLSLNSRRVYALAPCHHLYHTECLEKWMTIKHTCPLCKRNLPPL